MAVPTLTANSPVTGSIAWSAFNIQYGGVSYGVPAASTASKFVWWLYNAGSPTINAGDVVPQTLTVDDLVLFGNKNGTPINLQTAGLVEGGLIVSGSILTDGLSANSVTGEKILAGSVDATKIQAHTITSNEIAANTITANEIAANTITADQILANSISAEELASTIALVQQSITVGDNISIDTSDGIKIVTDDGFIQFPANKGRPSVVGDFTATSATIMDSLDVRGDENFISGTLKAASGVTPPATAPTLSNYWPNVAITSGDPWEYVDDIFGTGVTGTQTWGDLWSIGEDPAAPDQWSIWKLAYGSSTSTLVRNLGSGGVPGVFATFEPHYNNGKIAAVYNPATSQTEFFVLCSNWRYVDYPVGETFKLFRYNQDFSTKLAEYPITPTGRTAYDDIVIGHVWDSTGSTEMIGVAWISGATSKLSFRRYTVAGVASGSIVTSTWTTTEKISVLQDEGPNLIIGTGARLLAYLPSTLARVTASDYASPPIITTAPVFGVASDIIDTFVNVSYTVKDYSQGGGTRMYYHSPDNTPVTLWCKYTFYDNDPLGVYGAGGETTPSPAKSFTKAIGAQMRVDTPAPPDGGDPDDPNRIRYYLSLTNSGYQLKGDGTNATYFNDVASGPAPPTTNSWDSRPGNSGRLRSMVSTLVGGIDTGIWDLNGTGAGRVGPWSWDVNGNDLTDTGWINLTPNAAITIAAGSGFLQYRQIGKNCKMRWQVTVTASMAITAAGGMTDVLLLATGLASGVRPVRHAFGIVWSGASTMSCYLSGTDGNVRLQAADARGVAYTFAAGTIVQGNVEWFLG